MTYRIVVKSVQTNVIDLDCAETKVQQMQDALVNGADPRTFPGLVQGLSEINPSVSLSMKHH